MGKRDLNLVNTRYWWALIHHKRELNATNPDNFFIEPCKKWVKRFHLILHLAKIEPVELGLSTCLPVLCSFGEVLQCHLHFYKVFVPLEGTVSLWS